MTHEKTISDLAYHLWRARGCPNGSSEIDWAEAERQVRGSVSGSSDRALDAPLPAGSPVAKAMLDKAAVAKADEVAVATPDTVTVAAPEEKPKAGASPTRAKKKAKR